MNWFVLGIVITSVGWLLHAVWRGRQGRGRAPVSAVPSVRAERSTNTLPPEYGAWIRDSRAATERDPAEEPVRLPAPQHTLHEPDPHGPNASNVDLDDRHDLVTATVHPDDAVKRTVRRRKSRIRKRRSPAYFVYIPDLACGRCKRAAWNVRLVAIVPWHPRSTKVWDPYRSWRCGITGARKVFSAKDGRRRAHAEAYCLDCGHSWWSRDRGALRALRNQACEKPARSIAHLFARWDRERELAEEQDRYSELFRELQASDPWRDVTAFT